MSIKKYKYYFTKPRSEIGKDILYWLMVAGVVSIAATSPYFAKNLLMNRKRFEKYPKKKISSAFYNLKRQGLIDIQEKSHQVYISLTDEGKKKAGWLQIDNLKIVRPKKWDKKWRLVMFDISQMKRLSREAFRGKLKELGFGLFQKSIWIYPFDCRSEIELLQIFFGLSNKESQLVVAEDIGDDKGFKKLFNLF